MSVPEKTKNRKKIIFFTHELPDRLFKALENENIEIVAVVQSQHPEARSFSIYDLFEGGSRLAEFPTQTAPFHWLSDADFRIYARCIARLGFIPGCEAYETVSGGIVQANDTEEWARTHLNHTMQLINGINADEVWFGVQPHLGIDNILAIAALNLGKKVLTFRQIPFATKFFYYCDQLGKSQESPKLPWAAWSKGAVEPNLFYMAENSANPLAVGVSEKISFLWRNLIRFNIDALVMRLYAAAKSRHWWITLLLLDLYGANTRTIAFSRWHLRRRFRLSKSKAVGAGKIAQLKDLSYIYFPLHLEPELNSQILGGVFHNQMDALVELHKKLPVGWVILVKENPKQTYLHRSNAFFKRLSELERVRYTSSGESSRNLIENAQFTATITGTAAYESAISGKVGLYFGLPWYAGMPGTFAYRDDLDLAEIAMLSVNKAEQDKYVDHLLSSLADGIIFPRYEEAHKGKLDLDEVARTSAASLRKISDEIS